MRKMKNVWIVALCFVLVSPILVKGASENIDGVIESIDSGALQITVNGITVQATTDTAITITSVNDEGEKEATVVSFEDLAVGMTVKVCGKMVDGVLEADKINVKAGCAISE